MSLFDRRAVFAAVAATGLAVAGMAVATTAARASAGCQVDYTVSSQWPGGFSTNITVTDQGDAVTSWKLTWSFGAGQTVTQLWNGNVAQTGGQVSVTNAAYNGSIPAGGSVSLGFNGTWTGSNPAPADFALNGVSCEGSQPPPTTPPTTASTSSSTASTPSSTPSTPSSTPSTSPSSPGGTLPSSFRWSSSGILISPKSDSRHTIIAAKDPSVVFSNSKWYVVLSTVDSNGNYGMAQTSFSDWSQAGSAPWTYLDDTPIGGGYKTAPMVFYFAPQKLWYVTYQEGSNIGYSTNPDISNPAGWSAPRNFYTNGVPPIIQQNLSGGYWVDSWVICDSANCYLFSVDDNGHVYRSTSSLSQFPNGFGDGGNTVIAASAPNKYDMFEADNVYKVDGSNTYLMVVEAIGSDGRRLFHSWTADSLTGSWTPLAATQSNPFLAASDTTFSGTPWTQDLSSGEAIRSGYDQTVTLSPCHLQYLYQGKDPSANQSYNLLPWRIGLATQTNSTC
jgi:endo-1,4-beta-xylanase